MRPAAIKLGRFPVPLVLSALSVLCACGSKEEPIAEPPPASAEPAPSEETSFVVEVHVVDFEGRPQANMLPIATVQANAFDKPFAKGAPTDANGISSITLPKREQLYVRAWDPTVQSFANNFFEILPDTDAEAGQFTITMVPGSSLRLQLVTEDGAPLAATPIQLMMVHPSAGPWWPAEASSDNQGSVIFDRVPAGEFTIELTDAAGRRATAPNVLLPPKGSADLGTLIIQ
ncbi:MAG: hypothetical protein HY706_17160 [Candidatus Hydrogenedentes bacterium]|nr:hypothetical protein [Candidatus Hydrogenedentota bacterium]